MARKDAIEVEGKVVELLPQYHVSRRVTEWPPGSGPYFGKNAPPLHSYLARRQSYARGFPLRFVEGADHLPPEVTTAEPTPRFSSRRINQL